MVKLTKLRLRNQFTLFILLVFNSTYSLSNQGLYTELISGKFTKTTSSFVKEIDEKDSGLLWTSDEARLEYIYTLLENSTLIANKDGYNLASDLLFEYQSSNLTNPLIKKQIHYAMSLNYLSFMPVSQQSKETLNLISDSLPQNIFIGDRVIWAYNQLIDYYLDDQKYGQAFRYSMLGLAQLVKQPNTSPYQVLSFLVRLAQTQALMGKTNHFNHTYNLVIHIYDQYHNNILPNTPISIDSTVRFAKASTDAKQLAPIQFVHKKISDQLEAGISIPPRTLRGISTTFANVLASFGVDYDYESITEPLKESGAATEEYIAQLNIRHNLLAKINRGENIESHPDEHFGLDLFSEEQLLSVELYKNSQIFSEEEYITKLNDLRNLALVKLRDNATIYDFDFNNTFYLNNIIKTILLSVHLRYNGVLPENISTALIPLMETNRSELDLITKAKNAEHIYSKSKSSQVKLLLNVNKDIEYLTSQYLSQVKDNLKQSSEQFIEDTKLYKMRGYTLIEAIKKTDYYSENNDPLVTNSVLYPSSINLREIQNSLGSSHLFYYKVFDQIMNSCLISKKKVNCITKIVDRDIKYTKQELFQAISVNNKNTSQRKKVLNYFYNYLFDGHNFKSVKKIHLYPQEKDTTIPFATFQDNDGIFFGEKFELSLLPSLVLRLDDSSKTNFIGEYFGVANPSYGEIRNAIKTKSHIFNIRSVSLIDELSGLTQLPDTETEVVSASSSISSDNKKLLLRGDATEYNLRTSGFENYRMLHFATHGIVTGEFNGLRLPSLALSIDSSSTSSSTDGILSSNEISNLEINSDIAILSACQTLSDYGAGETGFSGLVSAFMASGVDSVLATMWKIESSSAAIIAADFVHNSSSTGNYSKALHETYKKYIHSQNYSNPFYWAPFVLVEQLKRDVPKNSNDIQSKVILNNKLSIDMSFPTFYKDEVWTILYEEGKNGIYDNFLFDANSKNKIVIPTFNTTITSIETDRVIFIGRPNVKYDSNYQIYSIDKSTQTIKREKEIENTKGFIASNAAKSKNEFAFYLTNNKLGKEKKSIISIYNDDYSLKGSVEITDIEKDYSRAPVLTVLNDQFMVLINHSNGYSEPISDLQKGYFSCAPYDNQTTSIYFIDEQVNLFKPKKFKYKKIHADSIVKIKGTTYALWRNYCAQETVFTSLESPHHKQFKLPSTSMGIYSGNYRGKSYIAGDFRSKSSFLVDYYKESSKAKDPFLDYGKNHLVLEDEKIAFTIMLQDIDTNWSTVHYSPKDLINTTLSLKVEGDVFKRLYVDRYDSIHEEEIRIRWREPIL